MAKISFEDRPLIPEEQPRTNVHYRIAQIMSLQYAHVVESTFRVLPTKYGTATEARNGIRKIVNDSTGFDEEDWYIIIQCF